MTMPAMGAAALRLYGQVAHLEVGDPDAGLSPDECGWPVATLCAAVAAPMAPLYDLLMDSQDPWARAFEFEEAPTWVLPWSAQFVGVEWDETGDPERLSLTRSDTVRRGSHPAIRDAALSAADDPATASVVVQPRTAPDGTPNAGWVRIVVNPAEYSNTDLMHQRVLAVTPAWLQVAFIDGSSWVTLGEFEGVYAGDTLGAFETAWAARTLGDFEGRNGP